MLVRNYGIYVRVYKHILESFLIFGYRILLICCTRPAQKTVVFYHMCCIFYIYLIFRECPTSIILSSSNRVRCTFLCSHMINYNQFVNTSSYHSLPTFLSTVYKPYVKGLSERYKKYTCHLMSIWYSKVIENFGNIFA